MSGPSLVQTKLRLDLGFAFTVLLSRLNVIKGWRQLSELEGRFALDTPSLADS
jgi:hypothetical protein